MFLTNTHISIYFLGLIDNRLTHLSRIVLGICAMARISGQKSSFVGSVRMNFSSKAAIEDQVKNVGSEKGTFRSYRLPLWHQDNYATT
jgi:hypothetical protein